MLLSVDLPACHYRCHGISRLLSVDDTGEGLVWERISLPTIQQQLDSQYTAESECQSAALSSSTPALGSTSTESVSRSPSAASAGATDITRFQCVGRLRVLVGLPTDSSPPVDTVTVSTSAASLPDVPDSAACRLLSSAPSCKIVSAHWSCTDRHVLTSSGDYCLRLWPTPPAGEADKLFVAECSRARRRRRRISGAALVLPSSKRSFVACVPLLQSSATFRLHTADLAVLRPHPRLASVVLTAGHDGRVAVWDVDGRRLLRSFVCNVEPKRGESEPAVAHFVDGSWSPSGDMCALSDEEGKVWLFGDGSRIAYQLAPTEQFYQSDYAPITLDHDGWVIDSNTQLPPHLMPDRTTTIIQASGQPYDPQPRMGTTPDRRIPTVATNTTDEETAERCDHTAAVTSAPVSHTQRMVHHADFPPATSLLGSSRGPLSHSTLLSCDSASIAMIAVSAVVALQADVARASLLASLRLEKRQRWQQSNHTSSSMAAYAARQRRDEAAFNEQLVDVDGCDGLWNDHVDELSDGQLHIAADVELDLAESDHTLDAMEDRGQWLYEVALAAPPTQRPATKPSQPPVQPTSLHASPASSATAATLTADEAHDNWRRAQRLVEAELTDMERDEDSRDEDYQPDDLTQLGRATNSARSLPLRASSRPYQQQQHQQQQPPQPYQLRPRESPLLIAAAADATAASVEHINLIAAEQAAMIDGVVARDIRAVQRAERRALLQPDDSSFVNGRLSHDGDYYEVGEDTPLQTRITGAATGRLGRNRRTHNTRRPVAYRRIEYKEDDWDLPMDDDNSDNEVNRDGGEWREEDDDTHSDEEEDSREAEDNRQLDEQYSSASQHGRAVRASAGRRRRAASQGRRGPQPADSRQFDQAANSESHGTQAQTTPQQLQPVRSSHRLAERVQQAHSPAEELTVHSDSAPLTSKGYHSVNGSRSKRTRYRYSASHSLIDDDYGSQQNISAETDEDSSSLRPLLASQPSQFPCRHQRGDEYAVIASGQADDAERPTPTAAADGEHDRGQEEQQKGQAEETIQDSQPAARADCVCPVLRITLRRLARREWTESADTAAERSDVQGAEAMESQAGKEAQAEAGLRRGRSRVTSSSSPAAAASVSPHHVAGSKRVRIVFGGQSVGTLDMHSVGSPED